GFAWRGEGDNKVFKLDGSHAGGGGYTLAACVWYEFFFGDDVRKFPGSAASITEEKTAALRKFAYQAVKGVRPKAWPEEIE
ncbi:MAG: hypothetical protein ABR497_12920, partial [Kiritimatiellia bacterium]